jgi:hypothetical protein
VARLTGLHLGRRQRARSRVDPYGKCYCYPDEFKNHQTCFSATSISSSPGLSSQCRPGRASVKSATMPDTSLRRCFQGRNDYDHNVDNYSDDNNDNNKHGIQNATVALSMATSIFDSVVNLSAYRHTARLPQHLHDPLSLQYRVSPSNNLITLYVPLPPFQFHQSSYRDGAQACSQSLIFSGLLFSASAAAMHHCRSQMFSAAIISAILRWVWLDSSVQK